VRFLSVEEVIELHRRIIEQSGGSGGLRDEGALKSSIAQPRQSFGGRDLYPTLAEKAAALGLLVLNGFEFFATVEEQEDVVLGVASGAIAREPFAVWVQQHVRRRAV
jgi:death-on-curing protein